MTGVKSRAIDMTGQTFGSLTVIERAPSDPNRAGRQAAMWRAICDCGKETIAEGVALRKGNRRSCGCRDPRLNPQKKVQKAPRPKKVEKAPRPKKVRIVTEAKWTPVAETASRWSVVERDGATHLLRALNGREAIVDHDGTQWVCSECGPQKVTATASGQCAHTAVVGKNLPRSLAIMLASRIAKPHKAAKSDVEKARLKSQADIIAAGEAKRAERARAHDEAFVAATPVVVRQMTDADRQKLEAARARRARTFQEPERSMRFVG